MLALQSKPAHKELLGSTFRTSGKAIYGLYLLITDKKTLLASGLTKNSDTERNLLNFKGLKWCLCRAGNILMYIP